MIVLGAATAAKADPAVRRPEGKRLGHISRPRARTTGQTGGTIKITGENISLTGAKLNASGKAGGGTVLIGGSGSGAASGTALPTATTVSIDAGSTINASAIDSGNGGRVVVWSDQLTTFAGLIKATGGATGGDGGFVETSGGSVDFTGSRVNTSAPAGKTGMWLIDPTDLTIDAAAAATISKNLDGSDEDDGRTTGTNITLTTSEIGASRLGVQSQGLGDINVNAPISWTSRSTLTLDAYHDVNVNAAITLRYGTLNLNANNAIAINSLVNVTRGGSVNLSADTDPTYGNTLLSFGKGGSVQFTTDNPSKDRPSLTINDESYKLLFSIGDVANINDNLSGYYALARPISASTIANWTPLGDFNGQFEGLGNSIDHLTIAPTGFGINNIGLFSTIDVNGMVSDLALTNVAITANPNAGLPGQFIGALAGQNAGLINNVTVTGVINGQPDGASVAGIIAGGLVGQNGLFGGETFGPGTIIGSHANVVVTLGDGTWCTGATCNGGFNYAGGLVGINPGIIANSGATGAVTVGANSTAGGLVGSNGNFGGPDSIITGTIDNSFATGAVFSAGLNVSLGGLVGQNGPQSTITNSYATGDVTATAAVTKSHGDCSVTGDCQYVSVGGLVGQNSGTIKGAIWETLPTACGAGFTCASGTVTVGSEGTAGGLVGSSDGIISYAFAIGDVIGAAGKAGGSGKQFDNTTNLGGLVGSNHGWIDHSFASGNVGSLGVAFLQVGGLVGDNSGLISFSTAKGAVSAGDNSVAGGLVASNSPDNGFSCGGCFPGDGFAFFNLATIASSSAYGDVTVGASSVAGGFAAYGQGIFAGVSAFGAVNAGANGVVGGLVGVLDVGGLISSSTAQNTLVASTGPNSTVGGLVGVNGGSVTDSTSTSPVSGGADSFIGGLIGVNFGSVTSSSVDPKVTGTGANDIIGGLVGLNVGSITDSTALVDLVSTGPGSQIGGLVGVNGTYTYTGPNPIIPNTSSLIGTVTGSTATGSGFTSLIGTTTPTSVPQFPSWVPNCNASICTGITDGTLQTFDVVLPPPIVPPPPVTQQTAAFTLPTNPTDPNTPLFTPISLGATDSTGGTGGTGGSGGTTGSTGGRAGGNGAPPGTRLIDMPIIPLPPGSGMPPPGEVRFSANEVVYQIGNAFSPQQVADIAAQFGLSVLSTESVDILGRTIYTFSTNGKSVREVIGLLEASKLGGAVQPNYTYGFTQQEPAGATKDADPNATMGDPAQYVIGKFQLSESHRLTRGDNVIVAVINSEIDVSHPDLAGVVAKRFDAGCGATRARHPRHRDDGGDRGPPQPDGRRPQRKNPRHLRVRRRLCLGGIDLDEDHQGARLRHRARARG